MSTLRTRRYICSVIEVGDGLRQSEISAAIDLWDARVTSVSIVREWTNELGQRRALVEVRGMRDELHDRIMDLPGVDLA